MSGAESRLQTSGTEARARMLRVLGWSRSRGTCKRGLKGSKESVPSRGGLRCGQQQRAQQGGSEQGLGVDNKLMAGARPGESGVTEERSECPGQVEGHEETEWTQLSSEQESMHRESRWRGRHTQGTRPPAWVSQGSKSHLVASRTKLLVQQQPSGLWGHRANPSSATKTPASATVFCSVREVIAARTD